MSPLPCHPPQPVRRTGWRGVCPLCGSFWDLDVCRTPFAYDTTCPMARGHFDPLVDAFKVAILRHWLARLGLPLKGHVVCEVGFRSGACLTYLQEAARSVYGIEQVPANLLHAGQLGVRKERLCQFQERPEALPEAVSCWLFQDSFEHIPEVRTFLAWLASNSTRDTLLFVVAPFTSDRGETSPFKILDAMACKRPVIASDLPSVRLLAETSRAIVLVPPDDPKALADAIQDLLADPGRRASDLPLQAC